MGIMAGINDTKARTTVYYMQHAPDEVEYARKLHERIRREFPEVRLGFCLLFVVKLLRVDENLSVLGPTCGASPRPHV